jgi:TPR repeat protein
MQVLPRRPLPARCPFSCLALLLGLAACSQASPERPGAQRATKSIQVIQEAAERGDPSAQVELGILYESGRGVPLDPVEASRWYRRAAERIYEPALFALGRQGAERGEAIAQYNVGNAYYQGQGVSQDTQKAFAWYRRAAAQGHIRAQLMVGLMYEQGRDVPQNYAEALIWYRKTADQGDHGAQLRLALMYRTGEGVTQDYVEAYKWYDVAASRASGSDQRLLYGARNTLARRMTVMQIAQARTRAQAWTDSFGRRKH